MRRRADSILEWARMVMQDESDAILKIEQSLGLSFVDAVEILKNCEGKVIITAIGKSGHIGRKIAATMASTGTPAFFVHPSEAFHGDLGMISSKDVVVAISFSGASSEVLNIVPVIKKMHVPLIGLMNHEDTPLGKLCDVVIRVDVEKEADFLNLAPTASTTATLAVGDALAVVLLKLKKFTSQDFAFYHPGGKLGRSLMKVYEVMSTPPPVVMLSDSFENALIESSRKNMGAVCVIDDQHKLCGIITDGDIRRIFQKYKSDTVAQIYARPLTELMTSNPRSIDDSLRAVQAVEMMENKLTYVLPVVNKEHMLVGIVRMHDLVQKGFSLSSEVEES